MKNRAAFLSLMLAFGLGIAGILMIRVPDDVLYVENNTCFFGTIAEGNTRHVTVSIRNSTGSPVQILGSSDYCTPAGCLTGSGFPIRIPPYGTGEFGLKITSRSPGKFSRDYVVFTDAPGVARFTLKVQGIISHAENHILESDSPPHRVEAKTLR